MLVRSIRCACVWAVLVLVASAPAARPQPKPADPAEEPLPEGAKLRFGTTRPILRGGPHVAPVGPKFDEFLAPTLDGKFRRYDLATGRPRGAGTVGTGTVVVSADGKRAAVARFGGITVVDVVGGKRVRNVKPPDGVLFVGVPHVSLSAKGDVLAFGGQTKMGRGTVVVWDVEKNEAIISVETLRPTSIVPVLSPDGNALVTHDPPPILFRPDSTPVVEPKIAVDPEAVRTAQVWDAGTGKELFKARVTGANGSAIAAAFSPDGAFLALSSGDGPVDLFDVNAGTRTRTLLGRKGMGVRVAISPDGKTVAAVGSNFRIQRWSADGTALDVTDPPPGLLYAPISGLQFIDNEKVFAWATSSQFMIAWGAPGRLLLSPLSDHAASIRSISVPAGGKDLFTSGGDTRVFRWDITTGLPLEAITLRPSRLPNQPFLNPSVDLSADATRGVGVRAPIEVFDLAGGTDEFVIPPASLPSAQQAHFLSPDGTKVITVAAFTDAKRAGTCAVWDLATERQECEVALPPTAMAPQAAISADGTRLIVLTTTHDPQTRAPGVRVTGWEIKTGKKLGEVTDPHPLDTVYVTAAPGDAAVLVSRTGRLWSVDYVAGTVAKDIDKLPFQGEVAVYDPVVFSPDGKLFATGAQGAKAETFGVRVYDWPDGKRVRTYVGHTAAVSAMRFTPDGKYLASGSQDTSVFLWDLSKNPGSK